MLEEINLFQSALQGRVVTDSKSSDSLMALVSLAHWPQYQDFQLSPLEQLVQLSKS